MHRCAMKISSDSETLKCNTSDIKFYFAKVLYIQIKIKFCTVCPYIFMKDDIEYPIVHDTHLTII